MTDTPNSNEIDINQIESDLMQNELIDPADPLQHTEQHNQANDSLHHCITPMQETKSTQNKAQTNRELILQIKQLHSALRDAELQQVAEQLGVQPLKDIPLQSSRTLRGHCAAVYACSFSPDGQKLCTVGMDNNLIVWNPLRNTKLNSIQINNPYTLTAKFAPDGEQIVYGGLDGSVYFLNAKQQIAELYQHQAYVSQLQFLQNSKIISASADKTCQIFDIDKNVLEKNFCQHFQDCLSVDVLDGSTFATGSADGFMRVFDYRCQKQVHIFSTQHADCNYVKFHPNQYQVGCCTSNNKCLLFDRRSEHLLQVYSPELYKQQLKSNTELKQMQFSKSGRFLFTCGEQYIYCFDVVFGNYLGVVGDHETQVTCLEISPDGNCLASGSWDTLIKIWA